MCDTMKLNHIDVSKCGAFINALKYLHCFQVTILFALYSVNTLICLVLL
jgi:hypothetical protein